MLKSGLFSVVFKVDNVEMREDKQDVKFVKVK
jgi:hypothetical protein